MMGCTSSASDKQTLDGKEVTRTETDMAGSLGVPSFPAAGSQQRLSTSSQSGRNKVQLQPGHSLMDWIRLGRSGKDLTGVGGQRLEVTTEELAKHNKEGDAWIALRGKVYNITPYLDFHPGGVDELMRGAGKDGTALFDEVHKWVNAESMLEKCLVGKLKMDTSSLKKGSKTKESAVNGQVSSPFLKPPTPPMQTPRFDWYQSGQTVTAVVYTKWTGMVREFVIVDRQGKTLLITMYIKDHVFLVHMELEDEVTEDFETLVSGDSGKVEVVFNKARADKSWSNIGKPLDQHSKYSKQTSYNPAFRDCTIEKVESLTKDTRLYTICLPAHVRMPVPIGYHVHMQHEISGMQIVRSYTVVIPSLGSDSQDARVREGRAFYLMIKIYPDGAFTPWLGSLKAGDTVPVGNFEGNFKLPQLSGCSHLVMFAAGTGFTPMVRLIYHCLIEVKQTSRLVKLLFFNKTEADIIWRDQLAALEQEHTQFTFTNCLSEAGAGWEGLRGRVTQKMVQDFLPGAARSDKLLICVCGPTPFTKTVVKFAEELGHTDCVHAFLA